jgi:predicted ATPase
VFLVQLAPLREASLVAATIAQALGVRETGSQPLAEALKQHLRDRQLLLILDNFEQILPAAPLVAELLAAAAGLKALATSRAPLNLLGEKEYPVPPLALPGVQAFRRSGVHTESDPNLNAWTPERLNALTRYAAVQLFLQRAQDVRPDFTMTPANAAAVAEICCRLDGLPLAIELAAARVRTLTPEEMLARLEQRFELLVGRRHDAAPRHRSLRATLDWSYQLLSPELQQFFARLSVFRGGWTLEAAAAIPDFGLPISDCGTGANVGVIQGPHSRVINEKTLEYLEELQRCSLVVAEVDDEKMRYRLLETLREYGTEQLTAEEQAALAQRHLDYYRAWIERDLPGVGGRTLRPKLEKIDREPDNLRAALDWWVQSGAALDWVLQTEDRPFQFLHTLTYFWLVRGYTPEGRRRLAQILSWPGSTVSTTNRAYVLLRSGDLARQQADFAAADSLIQGSLAIHQELGGKWGELHCCRSLADVARDQGDYARARPFDERHMALARELGAESEIANALDGMGYTAYLEGDLRTAQPLLARIMHEGVPDRNGIG